jgi:DNA-binding transcriptional ArsR family regulator
VDEDQAPAEVLDLLSDEYARDILAATSTEPMSANSLSERCDASLPTIYRRIERLQEQDLLEQRLRIDEDGTQREVYSARLASFSLELDAGSYESTIERTDRDPIHEEDTVDRLKRMWEGL